MVIYVPPAGPVPTGTLSWTWIDADGHEHDLTHTTTATAFVSRGSAGLGLAPVELVTEKLPQAAGGVVRYVLTKPLEIALPITVRGASFADQLGQVELLRAWFDTASERRRAPGTLRILRPHDDTARQIACYYTGGLEGDLEPGGPTGTLLVISLLAPDPYWTDSTDTELVYSPSQFNTPQGIVNAGDFEAYPVWTITGPGSAVTITNLTTGESFAFTANGGLTIGAGDQLIVDTRPSSQRTLPQVILNGDSAVFDRLTPTSSLWWFRPGANQFTIAISGTTGASAAELRWHARYRGVLR